MKIQVREEDGVVIVKPEEEIHFDNYKEVEDKINALISEGNTNIAIDLENVSQLYSMTLGMLNKMAAQVTEMGGRFSLRNISSSVRKMLKITRLDKIIETR